MVHLDKEKMKRTAKKFTDWIDSKNKQLKEYNEKAPERKEAEITKLDQEIILEKKKAELKKIKGQTSDGSWTDNMMNQFAIEMPKPKKGKQEEYDYIGKVI